MSDDVKGELDQLIARMDQDRKVMARWRRFHSISAYAIGGASLVLPLLLSTGVLGESGRACTPYILFTIAVLGGISTAYQPGVHAMERRQDAFTTEAMMAEMRIELLKIKSAEERIALLTSYSKRFHDGLLQRGARLVLAGSVSRQGTGEKKSETT